MQKKIMIRLMGLSLIVALLMVGLASAAFYVSFEQQLYTELRQEASLLASLLEPEENEVALLETMTFPNRVTLTDAAGKVLFDSQSDASKMENHLGREEIMEAAESPEGGFAKRRSDTLFEEQIYYAIHMKDGLYLRLAASQKTVGGLMGQMLGRVMLGMLAIAALAAILSRHLTRKLIAPINGMNFDDPLSNEVYDEFSPMLRRMAEQNQKIDLQMKALAAKQAQMNTLIENMREGLLMMDMKQRVLTMNKSAAGILQTRREPDGKATLMELSRNTLLSHIVSAASQNGSAHEEMVVAGRAYRVSASVVGRDQGMVLLFQDDTDAREAEQARKRFTANVSHELRTPLTAISGYAELIDQGMARPEDIPSFAHKIHQESRRLLSLVEDILRLSRLDEGNVHGQWNAVPVLGLAQSAAEGLKELAASREVAVTVEGDPDAMVQGDPILLEEMLRNLMENGIKYNSASGFVKVRIATEKEGCVATVQDNGIGIPKEHQSKVFERFYRVDSSRSKATGGTGLGLSIVKHGAEYHHASVEIESEPGTGTTVTLRFPKTEEKEVGPS